MTSFNIISNHNIGDKIFYISLNNNEELYEYKEFYTVCFKGYYRPVRYIKDKKEPIEILDIRYTYKENITEYLVGNELEGYKWVNSKDIFSEYCFAKKECELRNLNLEIIKKF